MIHEPATQPHTTGGAPPGVAPVNDSEASYCNEIDWRRLPANLIRLKELLGPDQALQIAGAYGGGSLYVPQSPPPRHRLCELLGEAGAARLAAMHGGERLDIPKLDAVHRQLRKRSILRDRARGRSLADLAAQHNLSRRRILQILAE